MSTTPNAFSIASEVKSALRRNGPIVALETAVVTHGLPYPENLQLAQQMEDTVRQHGATPATIAVLNGKVMVGITPVELELLATAKDTMKVSHRDFAPAIAQGRSGGTTVAGSIIVADMAGIRVFATGGIGGVHRNAPFDISTDLLELSRRRVIVVCAGAKAILDLPATIEYLETMGVPVIGYQTDEFPAFYSRTSHLPVSVRVDTAQDVARIAKAHWELGLQSAVLVTVPPPEDVALDSTEMEEAISIALKEVEEKDIHGQGVTPYLLSRVSELTGRKSLTANLGLLLNNARVAAEIATYMVPGPKYVAI